MKKSVALFLAIVILVFASSCDSLFSGGGNSQTMVDNDSYTIRILGMQEDSFYGQIINVYLENKSQDVTYRFNILSASINGVDCDGHFEWSEVEPGESSEGYIGFSDMAKVTEPTWLEYLGITECTDIKLKLGIWDANLDTEEPIATEMLRYFPRGEKNASGYERNDPNDIFIFDGDDIKFIVTETMMTEEYGFFDLSFCLKNKTDAELRYAFDDVTVNGKSIYTNHNEMTSLGETYLFESLWWSINDLSYNEITAVEKIEFILRAYNNNNECVVEEVIKIEL
ncbi:MAG: hypothetical protein E7634_03380 [Ruminococcaceae bacterium]|nr:hypothetical protein [Oscillospiraceae bacterium]